MKNAYLIVFTVLVAVGSFLFLQFAYPYHLFHREQTQLFLCTMDYWNSYAGRPAAIGCYLGDFITQFFYYIAMGPLIVALLLTALFVVARKVVGYLINDPWATIVGVLVAVWELFREFALTYPTSSTVCLLLGLLFAWVALHLMCPVQSNAAKWRNRVAVACVILLAFYTAGYGGWFTLAAVVLFDLKRRYWRELLAAVPALFFVFTLPLHYPLTTMQCMIYPSTSWGTLPESALEEVLGVDCEYYFGRYDKALKLTEQTKNQSWMMGYYHNLLAAKAGNLPENLLTYNQYYTLSLLPVLGPDRSPLEIFASNEAWFAVGDMTMTEHAAMLGQIFSPTSRSARMVRRLVEANLRNGDKEAAQKYMGLLNKTSCYRKWVAAPKQYTVCHTNDTLRLATDVPLSLRNLLKTNPQNQMALDYLLCYSLLQKDVKSFETDFERYALALPVLPHHRLYEEALFVALAAQNKLTPQNAMHFHLSEERLKEFNAYSEAYEQSQRNGAVLQPQYGTTYWFFYHFAKFGES